MATWIALLRGVNVGGKNLLPMAELRAVLEGLGYTDVRTYVQSGNVVLRSPSRSASSLRDAIAGALAEARGLRVPVHVLRASELDAALAGNPFPEVTEEKTVHFFFLLSAPSAPDLAGLGALAAGGECVRLAGRVLYLHAPEGLARSKLAAQVERRLGVEATARNLRTVRKLAALAEEVGR